MLTVLEKKERIKYYNENGKEEYAKKYKCKSSSANSCIFYYKKSIGIKIQYGKYAEMKEMLKYYKENGKEKTCKKYNINRNVICNKMYYAKLKLDIKCSRMEDVTISKEKKLEIIIYYKEHTGLETANKYGYKTAKAITSLVNAWADRLGILKPLKYKTKSIVLTDMQKRERVDDYLKYGIKYVKEKYGYRNNSYIRLIRGYAKQLNICIPIEHKYFYTRDEQKEMIAYYEENGKKAFGKKYKLAYDKIKRFKHTIKADTNMDI